MYNYEDIKEVHLEVTSRCQARCPMCPRRISGGPLNPLINLDDITLEKFKQWFPKHFIKQLRKLFMCGNLGDPIVAEDTLEIYKYIRKINPNILLSMNTNGSARSTQWWKELAETKVQVTFGIDGLADTHALYRVSTSWNKIIENAKAFIAAGGDARWDMLVFKHNEHQAKECEALSKELGFREFYSKHTSRFDRARWPVIDDEGFPTHYLEPTIKSESMIPLIQEAKIAKAPKISCKAVHQSQLYVSACGNISPCCWLDFSWIIPSQESRIDYMERIGVFPNLNKNTLEEIFESNVFRKIEETWTDRPLLECSKQCGLFDKLGEQFES